MFGYQVDEFGGPEVMIWRQLPDPEPGPGQVLVDVRATGINFAETRMRAGTYSGQPLPFVMGMEGAGVVAALGEGVTDFAVGQRVFGRARGCHAEQVVFDSSHLMPLPDNLSFTEGAAIPVGWLTAWHAIHTVGQARAGERVLVEAIGGSVGSAAAQIAKQHECWVAGTASRDEKLESAKVYGPDLLINYRNESVSEAIRSATDGAGVDISLMTIGEATADELLDSMGMEGRVIMFGSTGGRDITFGLRIGILNLQLLSMSISTSPKFESVTMPDFRRRAIPLFANGTFRAVVDTVMPITELVRAHEMIDERKHFGKVILEVG
ncbi:MAG: zinc-binding dehydrogenase [Woeseiaceae bacterium]|nr:zinc-binding dehydrogenase [Woeseiaceae bacterium]